MMKARMKTLMEMKRIETPITTQAMMLADQVPLLQKPEMYCFCKEDELLE